MPKFAANLSFLFQEVGFLDRFQTAVHGLGALDASRRSC